VYKDTRRVEETEDIDSRKKEDSFFVLQLLLRLLSADRNFFNIWKTMENMNASAVSEDTKPYLAEFKQKESRQFKSKAPKPGQKGFNNTLPGIDGLDDAAVICPWEEFVDVELSDLAQFGTA
ncbi:hypothetical protein ILYODFUR_025977, partial [Ilyodon furcidens]